MLNGENQEEMFRKRRIWEMRSEKICTVRELAVG